MFRPLAWSECAMVFTAGKNRWLSRNAVIAFRQPEVETTDLGA
jgi:hypothetical protein